jgi:hypothetical protein
MEAGVVLVDPGGSNIVKVGLALAGGLAAAAPSAAHRVSAARSGNRACRNGFRSMFFLQCRYDWSGLPWRIMRQPVDLSISGVGISGFVTLRRKQGETRTDEYQGV